MAVQRISSSSMGDHAQELEWMHTEHSANAACYLMQAKKHFLQRIKRSMTVTGESSVSVEFR